MPRNTVNEKHEVLELWAVLEVQKIWRAMDGKIPLSSLDEGERDRLGWALTFLADAGFSPQTLRDERNAIAHYDDRFQTADARACAATIQLVLEEILGSSRFESLWNSLQKKWSRAPFATRRERQDLLRRYETLFGGIRNHNDLTRIQQDAITHGEFGRCVKTRDRASHPNPPPTSKEVQEVLETFRTYSTRLRKQKRIAINKKTINKKTTTQPTIKPPVVPPAQTSNIPATGRGPKNDAEKKSLRDKKLAEAAQLAKAQADAEIKAARDARRQRKIDEKKKQIELDAQAQSFHKVALSKPLREMNTAERKHIYRSLIWSFIWSIGTVLLLTTLLLFSIAVAFMFPPMWIIAWIPFAFYYFVRMLDLIMPLWGAILVVAGIPVAALTSLLHTSIGWMKFRAD
jgi:hypothetical protein